MDAAAYSDFGVGYVNFYNPLTNSLQATGSLAIYDNSTQTDDLILDGLLISGSNPQFVDFGDSSGDIHDHVVFDLLNDATASFGAYGIMFQLQSDFATADGTMDLSSDPFWIIFNHGMSSSDFDNFALPAFGVGAAIPEPGTGVVLLALCGVVMGRRRVRA